MSCTAAALAILIEKAEASTARGEYAQAFSLYEKAIKCESTEGRLVRAVYTGCKAWPVYTEGGAAIFKARVKKYFVRVSKPNQDKLVQICVGNDRGKPPGWPDD